MLLAAGWPATATAQNTIDPEVARAEQLYKDGKTPEAIAVLDKYLQQHPADERALVDRGDAYEALDKRRRPLPTTPRRLRSIRSMHMLWPRAASRGII